MSTAKIQLAIVPHLSKPDPGTDPPTSSTFQQRLENALRDPNLQSCNEDTERAVRALIKQGIAVSMDPSQHTLGNLIVQKLLQPTSPHDLQITIDDKEPMTVPANTRLLFVHLSEYLDCTIYLFSNRSMPRVYRAPGGVLNGSRVCAILHCVDSYLAHSEYLVLSFAQLQVGASSTALSSSPSPPVPSLSQHPQPTHARYRITGRSRKRGRDALAEDEKSRMRNALRVGW